MLARLLEGGGLADAPELLGVVLGVAVRRRRMRWARDERERGVACGFGGRELVLRDLELLLHGPQRLELLRRRLALRASSGRAARRPAG